MDINKVKAVELTQEEAVKALADKVKEFNEALSEAESIADKYKLSFSISPAYGMGGTYDDDPEERVGEDWESSWESSSANC